MSLESLTKKLFEKKGRIIFVVFGLVLAGVAWKVFPVRYPPKIVPQIDGLSQSDQQTAQKRETNVASTLFFEPDEKVVSSGHRFSIVATVSPDTNHVSGAELHFRFDPRRLRLDKIVPYAAFPLILQPPKIDNEKGEASVALGVALDKPSRLTDSVIAELSFTALNLVGRSEVEFSEQTIVAADNEPDSVVKERKSAGVEIR